MVIANTRGQFFFALHNTDTTASSTRCLVENFQLKYVSKISVLNFDIVAVSRSCVRFFSFRQRCKAQTE